MKYSQNNYTKIQTNYHIADAQQNVTVVERRDLPHNLSNDYNE